MQGLPISPILFICSINAYFISIRRQNDGFPRLYNKTTQQALTLNSQGYADDDTLLCNTSKEVLVRKLTDLLEFCWWNNISPNAAKCGIQVINNNRQRHPITIQHPIEPHITITIPYVPCYKYLGFYFFDSFDINKSLDKTLESMNYTPYHYQTLLTHQFTPTHIKRQLISNSIAKYFHSAPIYGLFYNTPDWDTLCKKVQRVYHLTSQLIPHSKSNMI